MSAPRPACNWCGDSPATEYRSGGRVQTRPGQWRSVVLDLCWPCAREFDEEREVGVGE